VLLAVDANAIVLAGPDPHAQAQEAIALAAELAHAVLRRKWAWGQHCRCWTAI